MDSAWGNDGGFGTGAAATRRPRRAGIRAAAVAAAWALLCCGPIASARASELLLPGHDQPGLGFHGMGAFIRLALTRRLPALFPQPPGEDYQVAREWMATALAHDGVGDADRESIVRALFDDDPAAGPLFNLDFRPLPMLLRDLVRRPELASLLASSKLHRALAWSTLQHAGRQAMSQDQVFGILAQAARSPAFVERLRTNEAVLGLVDSHTASEMGAAALRRLATSTNGGFRVQRKDVETFLGVLAAAPGRIEAVLSTLYARPWGQVRLGGPAVIVSQPDGASLADNWFHRASAVEAAGPVWPWTVIGDTNIWRARLSQWDSGASPSRRMVAAKLVHFWRPEVDLRMTEQTRSRELARQLVPEVWERLTRPTFADPLPTDALRNSEVWRALVELMRSWNVGGGQFNGSGNADDAEVAAEALLATGIGGPPMFLTQDEHCFKPLLQRAAPPPGLDGTFRSLPAALAFSSGAKLTVMGRSVQVVPVPKPRDIRDPAARHFLFDRTNPPATFLKDALALLYAATSEEPYEARKEVRQALRKLWRSTARRAALDRRVFEALYPRWRTEAHQIGQEKALH